MPDRRTILSWDENKDCQTKEDNSQSQTLIHMDPIFRAACCNLGRKARTHCGSDKVAGEKSAVDFSRTENQGQPGMLLTISFFQTYSNLTLLLTVSFL